MRRIFFLIPILAWSLLLAADDEIKLMFGGQAKLIRKEQGKFLDFRYISVKDPMFKVRHPRQIRGWNYNPRGGAAYGSYDRGALPGDILLEHGIACRNVRMTIPYAPKEAVVKVYIGDWFAGYPRLWGNDHNIRLNINNKTFYKSVMSVENCFKEWCLLDEYVFSRHAPIWDRIVRPILKEYTFKVKNPDGKLVFDMTNILLTALIIAPDQKRIDEISARVEAERRAQFAARYPWKPRPDEPMPPLKGEKDMLLFQKSGLDNVHPWSRPAVHEITATVRAFAARGEQEMLRFGILPLRDLKDLFVQVGDFRNGRHTIPLKGNADFWRERYKERGGESTRGTVGALWRLDPVCYPLQENKKFFAEKGTPRMFTLDVKVPDDAVPGDYTAPLTVYSNGKVLRRGKLLLKVLPFNLAWDTAASYNFQAANSLMWAHWYNRPKRETIVRRIEERAAFLKKYGFHSAYFSPWGYGFPSFFRFGKIVGKPGERQFTLTKEQEANWDWWINMVRRKGRKDDFLMILGQDLFRNCGFGITPIFSACAKGKKVPPAVRQSWENDLKDIERIVGQIEKRFKNKGYPEFYWYFTGELDNFGLPGTLEAIRMAHAIRRAGGKSLVTINGKHAYKHTPAVFDHIWANPATPVDENLKKTIEKHGHHFGTHNSGDSRFQAGFHFWRTGGESRHQETPFYINFMRPFVYLPWNYNTALAYPAPDGSTRPTLRFLNYRDGRDDYLYLHTLETAIKRAPENSAARKNAEKFIAFLKKKIHFDPRMYHAEKFDGIEGTALMKEDEWNSISIERYRWQIARLIMALVSR